MQQIATILAVVATGAAVAWAGSQGGGAAGGWPVFAICAGFCFGLNWLAFVPSYVGQTEHYFDLTGSLTYVGTLALALGLTPAIDRRGLLVAALVACWAFRLGSFLFRRVRQAGSDGRFDQIKPSFLRFLSTWTLQALWVLLTVSCGLAAITAPTSRPLGWFAIAGTAVWLAGFTIEVVADRQKTRFRADPANRDRFIQSGLWARSRHPNYFGEIVLWTGIAIIALPTLAGWRWVTLVSPLFVYLLLTRVSGIPMLERRARRRWGGDPAFEAYLETTPVLVPR